MFLSFLGDGKSYFIFRIEIGYVRYRYCFYGCRNLVKVEFSPQQKAALKVIGVQAFAQCTSLESMDFGDMKLLGQMGAETFEGCSFLTIVKMPESLEQVPDRCFAGCRCV